MEQKISDLENLRREIDHLDSRIIKILARRALLSKKIALSKALSGLPVRDPDREKKVLDSRCSEAKTSGLDKTFITNIFKAIFRHSIGIQIKATKHLASFDISNKK